MTIFVYARAAIDFWPGWQTEKEFRRRFENPEDPSGGWAAYEVFRDKSFDLAKQIGWEGDIREGPFIAGLPPAETADDRHVMIAWKQDNNGDTFIASPFRLIWLEDGEYGKWLTE